MLLSFYSTNEFRWDCRNWINPFFPPLNRKKTESASLFTVWHRINVVIMRCIHYYYCYYFIDYIMGYNGSKLTWQCVRFLLTFDWSIQIYNVYVYNNGLFWKHGIGIARVSQNESKWYKWREIVLYLYYTYINVMQKWIENNELREWHRKKRNAWVRNEKWVSKLKLGKPIYNKWKLL